MINIHRRSFLGGLLAAPFIVAVGKVMPIKAANLDQLFEFAVNFDGSCTGHVGITAFYEELATGRKLTKAAIFKSDGISRVTTDMTPIAVREGVRYTGMDVSMPGSRAYFERQGVENPGTVGFRQSGDHIVSSGDTVTFDFNPPGRGAGVMKLA